MDRRMVGNRFGVVVGCLFAVLGGVTHAEEPASPQTPPKTAEESPAEPKRQVVGWAIPGTTIEQSAKLAALGAATDRGYLAGDLPAALEAQKQVIEFWNSVDDPEKKSAGFQRGAQVWLEYFQKAVEVPELGPTHKRLGEALSQWGRVDVDTAAENLERVRAEIATALGAEWPIVADLETMLAECDYHRRRLPEAEAHAQIAVDTLAKLRLDGVRQFGAASIWLGRAQHDQSRRALAFRNLTRGVNALKKCAPIHDPNMLVGRCLLCECRFGMGQLVEFEREVQETLKLHRELKLDLTANYALLAERLAHLFGSQRRFKEAKPLLEEALVIRETQSTTAPGMLRQTLALYRGLPPEMQDAEVLASATESLAAATEGTSVR